MWQADTDRRTYLVGVGAKLVVDAALAVGKPLAREDLDFAKEHDTNRAFNRYAATFPMLNGQGPWTGGHGDAGCPSRREDVPRAVVFRGSPPCRRGPPAPRGMKCERTGASGI
jgi:hypothetical protein